MQTSSKMSMSGMNMSDYPKLLNSLKALSESKRHAHMRNLARTDLYFLLRYLLGRTDVERPWLYDRCVEVQASPYGHLDLWAREHYKSTIITFAGTIQEILQTHGDDPFDDEVTVGIFSHTNKIANGFLSQIKRELETNQILKTLFPDVLWNNPDNEAPTWSIATGLIVKRQNNPKEPTVSAWGLVDGMPTGMHFSRMVYDDVVSMESVNTPDQIQKTTTAWETSRFLGTEHGKTRYIGTRYNYNDTYRVIMARKAAQPRIYPATDDGSLTGNPVMLSQQRWEEILRDSGPYTASCQMLQEPKADKSQTLSRDWLNYWDANNWAGMNCYLLADPANDKKKKSDWTSMNVVGIAPDGNKYWIDGVRDRLNLSERTEALIELHRKYSPIGTGYEQYGMQSDIEHIESEQARQNYRFHITPLGGTMGKNDRIRRMVPDLVAGKWYWPNSCGKTLYDGTFVDVIEQTLIEEYDGFPVPVHDDTLDSLSRIYDEDMHIVTPKLYQNSKPDRYARAQRRQKRRTPMSR